MTLKPFTVRDVLDIDKGRVERGLQLALDMVRMDLIDRPNLGKARTITLKLEIKPSQLAEDGTLDTVKTRFEIDHKMPKRATREYDMAVSADGQMSYNDLSPGNARQRTLDDAADDGDGKPAGDGDEGGKGKGDKPNALRKVGT